MSTPGRLSINVLYFATPGSRPVIASSSVLYTDVNVALNSLTAMLYGPSLIPYLPVVEEPPPEPSE
jgi:hypothetical protein